MLLGFAVGEGEAFQGIQPYAEIGGLDAAVLGPLASLLAALENTCDELTGEATPEEWSARMGRLLETFFLVSDEHEELLHQQLLKLRDGWLETCAHAGFNDPVPLSVVRETWLGGLDAGGLNQRFLAGAVSFCTLMPMRAIPFRLVCLLGMNDGDYPRQQSPLDFDLMRNDYRPGDRSRREDDRYLLLEALLSARDQLYISWVGRSIRDNSERPPSVLIGQLRDHFAAGWKLADGGDLLHALTREHPLQPFSRTYFEAEGEGIDGLFTYAREWREVHREEPLASADEPLAPLKLDAPIGLRVLADFLANPVNAFFVQRLKVRFGEEQLTGNDEEPFELNGLENWQLQFELSERMRPWVEQDWQAERLPQQLEDQVERLRREGRLPLAAFGDFSARDLAAPLHDLLARYREQLEHWANPEEEQRELIHKHADVELSDWLGGLRRNADGRLASLQLISGKLHEGRGYKWHTLVRHWVRHLALQLCGEPVSSVLVGLTGTLELPPLPTEQARAELDRLIDAWVEGMRRPLPVACKAAFGWLSAGEDEQRKLGEAAKRYDGGFNLSGEAGSSPALARVYPDFATLNASGEFATWAEALYGPLYNLLTRQDDAEDAA
ncbi:RecBCD enzyme subunit RecC [compost metagenome]